MNRGKRPGVLPLLGAGASFDFDVPMALEMVDAVCEMLVPEGVYSFAGRRFERLICASGLTFENYWRNLEIWKNGLIREVLDLSNGSRSIVHSLRDRITAINGGSVVDIEKFGASIDYAAALSGSDFALLQRNPINLDPIRGDLARLSVFIVECVRRLAWLNKCDVARASALGNFLRLATSSPSPTVATLNYDNGAELILDHYGIPWSYGFADEYQSFQRLAFRPSLAGRGVKRSFALLKLHGSSNWTIDSDFVTHVIGTKELEHQISKDAPAVTQPAAILFGAGKKIRYEGPFMALHCEFRIRLEKHSVVLVIGYSFRDAHINRDLVAWARRDSGRRIIAVDPSNFRAADGREIALNELLDLPQRQVSHVKHGVSAAFDHVRSLLSRPDSE